MTASNQEIAEWIEAGIETLRENDWTTGTFYWNYGGKPAFCFIGACNYGQTGSAFLNNLTEYSNPSFALPQELRKFFPPVGYEREHDPINIALWNDTHANSKEEVLNKMVEVAKFLREKG